MGLQFSSYCSILEYMKLIVGLGNPGPEYTNTRHNLGFMVLDQIAKNWGVHFLNQDKLKSELLVTMHMGNTVILAKPQTFMNLSGNSVQKIKNFYKLENSDIWVVSDDLDLDFGTIRVRVGGSSGGHNGLKSIIENIGDDFGRIRVGIKNELLAKQPAEKFVLDRFDADESKKLDGLIVATALSVDDYLKGGLEHNSKKSV
jgi:PTH1 family peptidyl-tRNA hydrolase